IRAHARRYAGRSQSDSVRGSTRSSRAASHGPAGTSSTASNRTPVPVITAGTTASANSSSGQSTVMNMAGTLVGTYDSFVAQQRNSQPIHAAVRAASDFSDGDDGALDGSRLDAVDAHVEAEPGLRGHVDGPVRV